MGFACPAHCPYTTCDGQTQEWSQLLASLTGLGSSPSPHLSLSLCLSLFNSLLTTHTSLPPLPSCLDRTPQDTVSIGHVWYNHKALRPATSPSLDCLSHLDGGIMGRDLVVQTAKLGHRTRVSSLIDWTQGQISCDWRLTVNHDSALPLLFYTNTPTQ